MGSCFRVSYLSFAASSCQRLNSSTSAVVASLCRPSSTEVKNEQGRNLLSPKCLRVVQWNSFTSSFWRFIKASDSALCCMDHHKTSGLWCHWLQPASLIASSWLHLLFVVMGMGSLGTRKTLLAEDSDYKSHVIIKYLYFCNK